jgi:TonB family protein
MLLLIAGKAALVAAAAHLVTLALARRSAAERHLVWVAAVAALLALPWLERTTPAMVTLASPAVTIAETLPTTPSVTAPAAASPVDWTMRVWLVGMLAVIAWQMVGISLLHLRSRRTYHLAALQDLCRQMEISRTVRLYLSPHATMPMTWGVFRPSIVLPEDAVKWTEERLRVVLMHELAHVARFDFLTQFAATLACGFYWYNPLVWLGAASMRKERERACDDVVLRHGANSCDYAEHLLALASNHWTPAGAVPMAEASHLESRIRAALNPKLSRSATTSRARLAVTALAAVGLLGVAVVKTNAQQGSSRIAGSVLDISGAVVPGAEVRAISANGSRRDIARSAMDGTYSFDGLPEGTYSLEVRMPGFAVLTKSGVAIKGGEAAQLNLTLSMGRIAENVEIVGKGSPAPPVVNQTRAAAPQRIRVGGNVQAAKIAFMPKPEYPAYLQAQGVEGTVLLEGVISTDGSLLSLRSLNSLVHADLVKAATDAVQRWRYQPTQLNGKPVEIITTITVNYRLVQ